jgi:hypothetical protein
MFTHAEIPFDAGIHLACLAVIISNWFDANCKWKKITGFCFPTNDPLPIHHFWAVSLLVVLQKSIVVDGVDFGHDFVNLSSLQLSLIIPEY